MKRNIFLLKLDYFFGGLWLLAPLAIIYFQQITKSYTLAMAVFSVASISTILLEVPSGILSDYLGRKKTLLICGVFSLCCLFLWALAGEFQSVLLLFIGAVLWGASDAFLSGTDEALMFETMEELGKKNNFNTFFASACSWNQFGLALSAIVGGCIVYYTTLQTVAWFSIFPAFLGLISTFFLKEPKRTFLQQKMPVFRHLKEALKKIISDKKLFFFSTINVVDNAINYPISRLEGAYFEKLIPLWGISFIRFCKQLLSMISFSLYSKIKKFKGLNILLFSFLGDVFFRTVGLIINNIIAPIVMSVSNLFYGSSTTVQVDILQRRFSENQRATMRSILSLAEKVLSSILFLFFGFLADRYSVRFALFFAVFIRILLTISIWGYTKKKKSIDISLKRI